MNPSSIFQNATANLPSALLSSPPLSQQNLQRRWSECTYTISKEAPFNSHPILSLTTQPCGLPVPPGVAAFPSLTTQTTSNNPPAQSASGPSGATPPEPPPTHPAGFAHWQLGIIVPVCIIVIVAVLGGFIYASRKRPSRKPRTGRQQEPNNDAAGEAELQSLQLTLSNLQRHEQGSPIRGIFHTSRQGNPPSTHHADHQPQPPRPPPPPPPVLQQPSPPNRRSAQRSPRSRHPPPPPPRSPTAQPHTTNININIHQPHHINIQIHHPSDGARTHARDDSGYASHAAPSPPLHRSPERRARAELRGSSAPARSELHGAPDYTRPLDFGAYGR